MDAGATAQIAVVIRRNEELSAAQRDQSDELCRIAFPPELEDGSVYAVDDWHLMIEVGGVVVSRLGVVDRTIDVGDRELRIAGVGGVATLPHYRKRGLARLVVERVGRWMCDELGADFGLLLCGEEMAVYYGKSGWRRIDGPVYADQPSGRRLEEGVTMILPARRSTWPAGDVDLRGLPF